MKPFLYAIADVEGRPVLDEICVAEHPSELELGDDAVDNGMKVVPVYTGQQIESLREKLGQTIAMIETTAAHEASARKMYADLLCAIERSGLDQSLCRCCGKLVLCIPDGLSNMCEPCAEDEMASALGLASNPTDQRPATAGPSESRC